MAGNGEAEVTRRWLRWLTVALPVTALALIDLARHVIWPDSLMSPLSNVAILAIVGLAAWFASNLFFNRIEAIEGRLLEQNLALKAAGETTRRQAAELRTLHEAGLVLGSNLSLEAVLQRVVELARQLVGARYGALSVLDAQGRYVVRFITSGIDEPTRVAIGAPPRGLGLLGIRLSETGPQRVDQISADPRSIGFPANHPNMTTFLGVPIVARDRSLGNLYLTDKVVGGEVAPFDQQDAQLLQLFAAQASVAMENARLHAEVQGLAATAERERIARELHDSLAQALGYIRLRAAAAREQLAAGDQPGMERAMTQIDEVAGDAFADIREAILGLRSRVGEERDLVGALAEYLERYHLQTGLQVALELGTGVRDQRLAPAAEAQLLRIIQEALANVRKHAGTDRATVCLDLHADQAGLWLRAIVEDQGRGFNQAELPGSGHYGLATMRERAESVGGRLRLDAAAGRGTRITAEFPVE